MICSNCGNEFEGKFCPECGTKAEVPLTICPDCGTERIGQSAFCANCGFSFKTKKAIQTAPPNADGMTTQAVIQNAEGLPMQALYSKKDIITDNANVNELAEDSARAENNAYINNSVTQADIVTNTNVVAEKKKKENNFDFKKIINSIKSFLITFKPTFANIYRYAIAGSMIFAGIIALLCLIAPAQIESMLGLTNKLGSGFKALGGDGSGAVITASVFLLLTSLGCLGYGGFQIYIAIKKPYFTVKNYFFWGVDAFICFMFFLCGCIVAGDCGSSELLKVKLGSGFGFSIAMGVFGFLFLAGRIFYEVKVFGITDTKVPAEEYAIICQNKSVLKMLKNHAEKQKIEKENKATKKQQKINNENITNKNNIVVGKKNRKKKTNENKIIDKKMSRKKIALICIPVAFICLVAIIVPAVLISNNIFRVGKVDKINIGDTKDQVINILGAPYTGYYNSNNVFEYYSNNYVELKSKLDRLTTTAQNSNAKPILSFDDEVDDDFDFGELEDDLNEFDKTFNEIEKIKNQLNNLVYKYIKVEFDAEDKVKAVTLDKSKSNNINNVGLKTAKSLKLENKDIIAFTEIVPVIKTKYSDGSFYKCAGEEIMFRNPRGYNKKTKQYEIVDKGKEDRSFKFTDSWGNEIDKTIYNIKIKKNPEILTIFKYKDGENRLGEIVIEENVLEEEYRKNNFDVVFAMGYDDNVTMRKYNEIYYDVTIEKGYEDLLTIFADWNIVNIISEYEAYDVQNKCVIKKDEKKLVLCLDMESDIVVSNGVSIIGEKAFYDCTLLSVTLPNSVTRIENEAFFRCKLFSVTIPKSVISVAYDAFSSNLGLTIYKEAPRLTWNENLNCPIVYDCNNNNIANDGYIYTIVNGVRYAIKNDSAIMATQRTYLSGEVIIPQNITYEYRLYNVVGIDRKAFGIYHEQVIVYFEYDNALYLGNEQNPYQLLVKAKSNDITSCEINSNTKGICSYAFSNCNNLSTITIPNSVVWLGEYLFGNYTNVINFNYLGDIASWCQMDRLGSLNCEKVIVDGVALKDLKELVIPNGVTKISDYAFYNCSSLTSVTIPDSVKSIGRAFYNCKNIDIINYLGDIISWCQMDRLDSLNCEKVVVDGVVLKDLKELVIPNGVTKISEYAFSNCSSLTSVTISDSVLYIYEYAFSNCSSLTSITIPDSVLYIGGHAFSGCSSLTNVEIGNGVVGVEKNLFANCENLKTIQYNGTTAQWINIEIAPLEPEPPWVIIKYDVICTDGVIKVRY